MYTAPERIELTTLAEDLQHEVDTLVAMIEDATPQQIDDRLHYTKQTLAAVESFIKEREQR